MKKQKIEEAFINLFENISFYGPLFPEVKEMIRVETDIKKFLKGEFILMEGEICKYCYFVISGIMMAYFQKDEDGENEDDAVVWFMSTGDVAIGVTSFYEQSPSKEFIVALEDTICIRLSYEALQRIYDRHVEFNIIGRRLTEKYHMKFHMRNSTIVYSAKVRYKKFQEEHPNLVNRIPNIYIASYIGITPSHLSKIKNNR